MLLRHTIAQLFGRGSTLVTGLISVPIYLSFLGAEAYGIVGVYLSLQVILSLLDFGIPITANREIARLQGKSAKPVAFAQLIRSFETAVWALALIGFALLHCSVGWVAIHWLNLENLSPETASHALQLAALGAALRFPCTLYTQALFGVDRHTIANCITAGMALCRMGIVISFLTFSEDSLSTFFLGHIYAHSLELLLLIAALWWPRRRYLLVLPQWKILRNSLHMTAPLTAISVTALVQSQMDKAILSYLLPLSDFGIYSVAYSLAVGILPLAYSAGNAVFPSLSRLSKRDKEKQSHSLSYANTLLAVLILPLAATLMTQSASITTILQLFTEEAAAIMRLLPYLITGMVFQCFVVLPHHYRVAEGEPGIIFKINLAHLLPYGALLWAGSSTEGTTGAALAVAGVNASVWLWHGITLRGEPVWKKIMCKNAWLFASLSVLGVGLAALMPVISSLMPALIACGSVFLLLIGALMAEHKEIRALVLGILRKAGRR